jgi:hypothetical protein
MRFGTSIISKSSSLTKFLYKYNKFDWNPGEFPQRDRINITWKIDKFINRPKSCDKVINFQRILIQEPIIPMIFHSYDLDLCRNYYDGSLHVSNWDTLIRRSSSLKPSPKLMAEYLPGKRWFGFMGNCRIRFPIEYNDDWRQGLCFPDEFLKYQISKVILRKEKYESRGFTITPIDNFEEELLENYKEYITKLEFFDELNIDLDSIHIDPIF